MTTPIKKGTRVIINIERRTLKIILWLNLFLFIGLFLLGFVIGKSIGSKEIKIAAADDIHTPPKQQVVKKEKIQKPAVKTKILEKEKTKKSVKKTMKYPPKIVVEKKEKPKPQKTKKKVTGKSKTYTIQVISLKDLQEAKKIRDSLKRQECDARVSEKKLSTGIWYRVRIGNYITKEIAFKEGKKLEEKGIINSFWISEND